MIIFSPDYPSGDVSVYENLVLIGTITHEQTTGGTKASEYKWLQLIRPNREMLSAEDLRAIADKLDQLNAV